MRVYLTFDVEIWCDGWAELDRKFPRAFDRYVYGQSAHGQYALPKTLEVLARNGLKGVFFVEPLFSARFGRDPLTRIVELIQGAGQSVQLHLHPEWCDEVSPALIEGLKAKQPNLYGLSLAQQSALIGIGLNLLKEAGAAPIHAFRAGSYAANIDTLSALAHVGLTADSSYNVCYASARWDATNEDCAPLRSTGQVGEYPIAVFEDGFDRLRPAQVGACSLSEMIDALESAYYHGETDFVIVSHNFEMLRPGCSEPDWIVVRRFEGLCAYLAKHRDLFSVEPHYPRAWDSGRTPGALPYPKVRRRSTLVRHAEQAWRRLVR